MQYLREYSSCHGFCFEAKTTPAAPWLAMPCGYCDPGRVPQYPRVVMPGACGSLSLSSTGHANAPMRNASGGRRSRWRARHSLGDAGSLHQYGRSLSANPVGVD
jgi:hypothetical protein